MAKKVKSYKRRDGTKVKAHVRKGNKGISQAVRERRAGRQAQHAFTDMLRGTKPAAPRKPRLTTDLRKSLNKITRTQKRRNG